MHPYRTHTCNELRASDAGKTVRLSGWMFRLRDHGGIILRGDQVAVGADDDPLQSFVCPDPPDRFLQLQLPVSPSFVLLPDPVMSDLDIFRPVARIPCHKPDGLPVQAGDQAVFVSNIRIVIEKIICLFPVRVPDSPVSCIL